MQLGASTTRLRVYGAAMEPGEMRTEGRGRVHERLEMLQLSLTHIIHDETQYTLSPESSSTRVQVWTYGNKNSAIPQQLKSTWLRHTRQRLWYS